MFVKSIGVRAAVADTSVCSYFRAPLGTAEIFTVELPPPPPPPPVVAGVVEEELLPPPHAERARTEAARTSKSGIARLVIESLLRVGSLYLRGKAGSRWPSLRAGCPARPRSDPAG